MDVRECLEKGLLKKEIPSAEKAKRSLEMAEIKLKKAKELFKLKVLDMAEVNAYSSMFHSSRALLFKDGFKERSHYAIYVYLKEKYSNQLEPKFLNELNVLRLDRHEIFYGLEELELEASAIKDVMIIAEEFLGAVEGLL